MTVDRAVLLNRKEIRVRGQGGQGAISVGYVFAKAATMYAEKDSILTEAYGPEVTGGFARADVIIQDDYINFPMVTLPEIFVCMSREAWEEEKDNVAENGIVVYEEQMTALSEEEIKSYPNRTFHAIPALKIAYELQNRVVMNVVLMAATVELTELIPKEAFEKALWERVPGRFKELNEKALARGYEYAQKMKEKM